MPTQCLAKGSSATPCTTSSGVVHITIFHKIQSSRMLKEMQLAQNPRKQLSTPSANYKGAMLPSHVQLQARLASRISHSDGESAKSAWSTLSSPGRYFVSVTWTCQHSKQNSTAYVANRQTKRQQNLNKLLQTQTIFFVSKLTKNIWHYIRLQNSAKQLVQQPRNLPHKTLLERIIIR